MTNDTGKLRDLRTLHLALQEKFASAPDRSYRGKIPVEPCLEIPAGYIRMKELGMLLGIQADAARQRCLRKRRDGVRVDLRMFQLPAWRSPHLYVAEADVKKLDIEREAGVVERFLMTPHRSDPFVSRALELYLKGEITSFECDRFVNALLATR